MKLASVIILASVIMLYPSMSRADGWMSDQNLPQTGDSVMLMAPQAAPYGEETLQEMEKTEQKR